MPPDELHILEIAVQPEYRRQGVASLLLGELVKHHGKLGARKALLEYRAVDSQTSGALYRKMGFVEVGRRKKYYKDGQDAVLMDKQLLLSGK